MRDIVIGKLVDHTIDDDYEELSERLFGEGNCFSGCETRKRMYGMRAIIEAIERDTDAAIYNEDRISELDIKKNELAKERQRFFDQRREYNKALSQGGRSEYLEERLIAAADNLNKTIGRIEFGKHSPPECQNEAVLILCDWHYGMKTKNVWNTYDTEICKQRVEKVVESAIQRIQLHECKRLHVVILGDLVHGAIHTSARVASEELVCDQIMNVAEILAQAIEHLGQYVSDIQIHMTYGNHARTVQKKDDNIHRDNMERIIPWWLSQRLKDYDWITMSNEADDEFLYLDVCGYGICASHGDLDSVKSSPRLLSTLFHKKYGKNIDYILLADKHHRESFEELGVSAVICGALCGADEYANNKRLYSTPEQLLLILSGDTGVDAEYHLKCS